MKQDWDVSLPQPPDSAVVRGDSERDLHWSRVSKFLDERELDGLLAFGHERFGADHYLTNDQPGVHVVFPRDGELVATSPFGHLRQTAHFVSAERGERSWLRDVRSGGTGRVIAELLIEKGLDYARVGVVGLGGKGEGWVPHRTWVAVTGGVPAATFVDVQHELTLLLLERSQADVACLRYAAAVGEVVCRAMLETIRAGATEAEVYAEAVGVYSRHGVRTVPPSTFMMQSGADNFGWGPPAWLARPQPPRRLQRGDVILTELFGYYGMLETQLQLAAAIGPIHHEQEACAAAARRAYEAGLRALRPGVAFEEVCDAMEAPISDAGAWHLTPLIQTMNPFAFSGPDRPPRADQAPELVARYRIERPADTTDRSWELRPGMAFAFEPNAHIGRHRVNVGGTVVVTERGAEELNRIPTELQRLAG